MGDNATDLITVAISVTVTAVVIIAILGLTGSAKEMATMFTKGMNKTNTAIEEYEYTKWTEGEWTGDEVLSFLRQHANDSVGMCVGIKHDSGAATYYTNVRDTDKANLMVGGTQDDHGIHGPFNSTSCVDFSTWQNLPTNPEKYFNPNSTYTCSLAKNENGTIKYLFFNPKHVAPIISTDSVTNGQVTTQASGSVDEQSLSEPNESAIQDAEEQNTEDQDLSVLFSDDGEKKKEADSTAEADTLEAFKKDLSDLHSQFDAIDVSNTNEAYSGLNELKISVKSLKSEYEDASSLSDTNKKFVKEAADELVQSIEDALDSLKTVVSKEEVMN